MKFKIIIYTFFSVIFLSETLYAYSVTMNGSPKSSNGYSFTVQGGGMNGGYAYGALSLGSLSSNPLNGSGDTLDITINNPIYVNSIGITYSVNASGVSIRFLDSSYNIVKTLGTGLGTGTKSVNANNIKYIRFVDNFGSNSGALDIQTITFTDPIASDTTPPSVTSISLSGSPSASSTSISYNVTFDESVTNVSIDDFELMKTSSANGTISNVSGSGTSYTVTVSSINGSGTLRLDLKSNTNIIDSSGNGNNTNGYVTTYTSASTHTVSVNSNPTASGIPTDVTVTEDLSSNVSLFAITFADVDGDSLTVTLTASAGTFTSTSGGGVTIGGSGTGTLTLAGTAANINTFLDTATNIKYTGVNNVNGDNAATFTIKANDGTVNPTLGTVNLDISAENDAPTASGVPSDVTVVEDTLSNVDLSAINFTDVDSFTMTVTLTVSAGTFSSPADGSSIGEGSGVTETLVNSTVITLAGNPSDINAYLNTATNIKYTGASNVNGNASATMTVSANDGDGSGNVNLGTVNINITEIADTPSITNTSTNKNSQSTSGLVISRNANDSSSVTHFKITSISEGILYKNDGTTAISNNDFITYSEGQAGLKFTPTTDSLNSGSFNIQGATSNIGAGLSSASTTATITVNAVADTPSVTNTTTNEDTQTTSGLVISRNASDGAEVTHFKITSISGGTLYKNDGTTIISSNDLITYSEGQSGLKFTPSLNSTSNGTFNVQGATSNVGAGLSSGSASATITVSAVNDNPTVTSTDITSVNEDNSYIYSLSGNDIDGDSLSWSVKNGTTLPSWLRAVSSSVTTFAGNGILGSSDAIGTSASFNHPSDVTIDSNGNIYVVDSLNHEIRKITTAGVVSTLAGDGTAGSLDGIGTNATFDSPSSIVIDSNDNLFVFDKGNHKVRKITPAGVVSTFAGTGNNGSIDGSALSASFGRAEGIGIDSNDNLFIADTTNHKIRKITPAGVVSTIAGSGLSGSTDGIGISASFYHPHDIAIDSNNSIYVADYNNQLIRKISTSGVVSTFAGSGSSGSTNGIGTAASFYYPIGIDVDSSDNVYVSDQLNSMIRKITPSGVVSTFAGSGAGGRDNGVGTIASFYSPWGLAIDNLNTIYVADRNAHTIRKISSSISLSGTPTNDNVGANEVKLTLSDGNGGSVNHEFTINVVNINDKPTAANDNVTIDEDNSKTFSAGDFNFSDVDSGDALDSIIITSLPTKGTLKLSNTVISLNQSIAVNNIGNLVYSPISNEYGTSYTSFKFKVNDGDASSTLEYTTTINVTAQNDTPTITLPTSPSVNEDSTNNSISDDIQIGDFDVEDITVTLTSTNGTISVSNSVIGSFLLGDGTDDNVIKFREKLTDINSTLDSLTFTPNANFDGIGSIKVDVDDGIASLVSQTLNITVNNAPEITSIVREEVPPGTSNAITNADSLVFYVYISDQGTAVGADATDFQVSGGTTATVTSIVRQSIYFVVTVSGGDLASYNGTVGLNFIDNNSIKDNGVSIGGEGIDSVTNGETYTLDNAAPTANLTSATDNVGSVTGILHSGAKTDDTVLVLHGTNELDATRVEVFDGNVSIGLGAISGTTWTYFAGIADGTTYQFNVKETDVAGNVSAATSNFTIIGDRTAPTANLTAATDDVGSVTGALNSGDSTDDASLVLSGTNESGSSVKVYDGTTLLGSATVSGTTWTYTATLIDETTYQFNVKETDTVGNESTATSNFEVYGDTVAPIVTELNATVVNGEYKEGQLIGIYLNFNEPVTITGTPQLTLETGTTDRIATYSSLSGSTTLIFNYTVQAGDTSADLDYISTTALSLNGGTIRGAAGNDATLTLPSPGATGSLGASKAIVIDTSAPDANLASATDNVGSITGALNSGDSTDDTSLVLSGTNESGASVKVYNGTTLLGSATVTQTSWTYTATIANGVTYQFNVKETDKAGNESAATSNFEVTGDTTIPAVSITSSKTNVINKEEIPLTFTLTEESGNFVESDINVTGGNISNFTQDTNNAKVYTATLRVDDTSTLSVGISINSNTFSDISGNFNSATQKTLTILPSVKTYTPSLNASSIAIDSKLVLEFSEYLSLGTGNIEIKKISDDSIVETIDVTSSTVVLENPTVDNGLTNTRVTITRNVEFDLNIEYYVTIDNTAFKDVSNNNYTGISDKVTWKFTSVDNAAPIISNNSSNASASINVNENQTSLIDIDATDVNSSQTLTYSLSGTDVNSFDIESNTGVITFKTAPNFETKNIYSIVVTVTDNGGGTLSDTQTLSININDINDNPNISIVSSMITNEDESKAITYTFIDEDNNNVSAIQKTAPSNGAISINASTITYTPNANYNGSDSFVLSLSDGNGYSIDKTISVTVNAVDDAPIITTILTNESQSEDGRGLVINLTTSDIDNIVSDSTVSYTASSSDTSIANAYIRDNKLIVVPVANANGIVSITLTTSVNGLSDTKTFTYTLTEVNDLPTISNIGDITHEQSASSISKTISFDIWDDTNVESLSISSSNNDLLDNTNLSVNKTSSTQGELIYTISANNAGHTTVTVVAKDSSNLEYSESFNLSVTVTNDSLCVENTKTALVFELIKDTNDFQNSVTNNLDLVNTIASICDSSITWASSDTNIVDNNGLVSQSTAEKTIEMTATITKGEFSANKAFLITIPSNVLSDSDVLNKITFETIKDLNESRYKIISNLELPTTYLGKTIVWTSSNDAVISPYSGFVSRTSIDEDVTLSAKIGNETKNFNLKVLKGLSLDSEIVNTDKNLLTIESLLNENIDKNSLIYNLVKPLPSSGANSSTIIWESTNSDYITTNGDVIRDSLEDKYVTLKATITKNGISETKEFDFKVLQNKIEEEVDNTFKNAGTTTSGIQVTTTSNGNDTQTTSSFAATILSIVETVVSQESIKSVIEFVDKVVNVYLNTDGSSQSTLQTEDSSISMKNQSAGASTSVEDDGDIISTATTSNGSVKLQLNNDGTVTHEVTNTSEGKTSSATSNVANSSVESNEDGTVETTSEVKQSGFLYKAIVTTDKEGQSETKFVKVDLSSGSESDIDSTLDESSKFPVGNEIEISEVNGELYIKTTTPLDGQLKIK